MAQVEECNTIRANAKLHGRLARRASRRVWGLPRDCPERRPPPAGTEAWCTPLGYERTGNNLQSFKDFNLKSRPESGLDCLACAICDPLRSIQGNRDRTLPGLAPAESPSLGFYYRRFRSISCLICLCSCWPMCHMAYLRTNYLAIAYLNAGTRKFNTTFFWSDSMGRGFAEPRSCVAGYGLRFRVQGLGLCA